MTGLLINPHYVIVHSLMSGHTTFFSDKADLFLLDFVLFPG